MQECGGYQGLHSQKGDYKNSDEEDHQKGAGENKQSAYFDALRHENGVVMLLILLTANVVKQANLFTDIALRGEKTAPVHLLVQQRITLAHDDE
ncbi:hypothetical protein A3K86_08285 [Photobacterium jeanii]|uniref:Uncharacterized protein n=1 Tax=Photobacterium jeanii TaxID=858640 RepID=A0A178KI38_9GAMM|nr:hypothetical protein A3K86_08285 [Photobacterium jeanii]